MSDMEASDVGEDFDDEDFDAASEISETEERQQILELQKEIMEKFAVGDTCRIGEQDKCRLSCRVIGKCEESACIMVKWDEAPDQKFFKSHHDVLHNFTDDSECAICMEPMSPLDAAEAVCILDCGDPGHAFHASCVKSCTNAKHKVCPLCRTGSLFDFAVVRGRLVKHPNFGPGVVISEGDRGGKPWTVQFLAGQLGVAKGQHPSAECSFQELVFEGAQGGIFNGSILVKLHASNMTLIDAVKRDDIDLVKDLLQGRCVRWDGGRPGQSISSPLCTEEVDDGDMTALVRACTIGNVDMVKLLLNWFEADSSVSPTFRCGVLVDLQGWFDGFDEPVRKVFESFQDPSGQNFSILMRACRGGDEELFEQLLDIHLNDAPALLAARDTYRNSALHHACCGGSSHIVDSLLEVDDVAETNNMGRTGLHYAVEHRHLEVAKMLLDRGIDVNLCDSKGNTALHLACKPSRAYEFDLASLDPGRQEDIIRLLLSRGDVQPNKLNSDGRSAFSLAFQAGDECIVPIQLVLDDARVDPEAGIGETGLVNWLSELDFRVPDEVQSTIFSHPKVDVNRVHADGDSALHGAIAGEVVAGVQSLLKNPNINVNVTSRNPAWSGESAFIQALGIYMSRSNDSEDSEMGPADDLRKIIDCLLDFEGLDIRHGLDTDPLFEFVTCVEDSHHQFDMALFRRLVNHPSTNINAVDKHGVPLAHRVFDLLHEELFLAVLQSPGFDVNVLSDVHHQGSLFRRLCYFSFELRTPAVLDALFSHPGLDLECGAEGALHCIHFALNEVCCDDEEDDIFCDMFLRVLNHSSTEVFRKNVHGCAVLEELCRDASTSERHPQLIREILDCKKDGLQYLKEVFAWRSFLFPGRWQAF